MDNQALNPYSGATSWSELNQPVTQPVIAAEDDAIDFAVLFSSAVGQRVLAAFRRQTIERPGLGSGFMDGQAMNNQLVLREGENNLYRWILSQIRKGELAQKALQTMDRGVSNEG